MRHLAAAQLILALLLLLLLLLSGRLQVGQCHSSSQLRHCATTPLFVFGASMMDVGQNAQAFPLRSRSEFPPYGLDYFSRPSRRFSNGRLIIDFINQGLGNGLGGDPYLTSVEPNFTCGVNFASSGSTARNSTVSGDGSSSDGLFSFSVQVDQYAQFRENILSRSEATNMPSVQDLLDGIYLIEMGLNDYSDFMDIYPYYDVEGNVSATLAAIEAPLRKLHASGAQNIVVMNVIPAGCAPIVLGIRDPPLAEQDEYGCFAASNDLSDLHNSRLEDLLLKLSDELPSANWTLFDANSIFKNAIQNPESYGIKYISKACCGAGGGKYNFNANILCGKSGYIDGVFTTAWRCDDPSSYIFWDTLHPVESFAQVVAEGFLSGEFLITLKSLSSTKSTMHHDQIQ